MMKAQRIGGKEKRHPQILMKKTKQLNIGEVDDGDRGVEEGFHMACLF